MKLDNWRRWLPNLVILRYASPQPWASVAPAWILSLWVGFALTLNHSLYPLKTARKLEVPDAR